jgi:hypothetical protein
MKRFILILLCTNVFAQQAPEPPQNFIFGPQPSQIPTYDLNWTEGDGTVPIVELDMFGQITGRVEVDWIPRILKTSADAQRSQTLFQIPGHLSLWIYDDGVHGEWFNNSDQRRLFRTRWGLPAPGVEIQIIITWDEHGYAVIVDSILRIHDWQTQPTTVFPDPDITNGALGSDVDGDRPATGSFNLRVYDLPKPYSPCGVDIVGTINEGVPDDNTGSWSQGIDPRCFTRSATLSWQNPIQYEDGTDLLLSDLQGIGIYNSDTDEQITIVAPTPTTTVIDSLAFGQHCFYSTAIDIAGVESIPSNIACKDVQ